VVFIAYKDSSGERLAGTGFFLASWRGSDLGW